MRLSAGSAQLFLLGVEADAICSAVGTHHFEVVANGCHDKGKLGVTIARKISLNRRDGCRAIESGKTRNQLTKGRRRLNVNHPQDIRANVLAEMHLLEMSKQSWYIGER